MEGDFAKLGYEIHHNVVSPDAAQILGLQLEICKRHEYQEQGFDEDYLQGDPQVPESYCRYGNYAFESLLVTLKPMMEYITGKTLYPSHTYSRIYYNNARLDPHYDSPRLSYSMTMTLDIDQEPWPIYIKGYDGVIKEAILPPGSALVYHGSNMSHWRRPYTGKRQTQTFLHWVDDIKYIYDGRKCLGSPYCGAFDE